MDQLTSPVSPALRALEKVRAEVKTRIGKPGGNLNEKVMGYLDTIEATLNQIEPLSNMLKVINQQTEVAVHGFRALGRIQLPAGNGGGDDGSSETKGE